MYLPKAGSVECVPSNIYYIPTGYSVVEDFPAKRLYEREKPTGTFQAPTPRGIEGRKDVRAGSFRRQCILLV